MQSSKKPPSYHLHYAAALDPWLRRSYKEVEWFIKLSALTSKHIVISDNQAINNKGLQRLLRRSDVLEFLFTPENDGITPLVVSLREGVTDFDDILTKLVLDRETPPIFPWMTRKQQKKLDFAQNQGQIKSLGHLLDIAGNDFVSHIEILNHRIGDLSIVRWRGLEKNYPSLVQGAINRLLFALEETEDSSTNKNTIFSVCDEMFRYTYEEGVKANRSNLFRIIANSSLDITTQQTLALKLLDEPYHLNFARRSGYNMITGSEYNETSLNELLSDVAETVQRLSPEELIEINEFPVQLDQVPFSRIREIRNLYSFKQLIDSLRDTTDDRRVYVLRDLLNLIYAELAKEPKGLQKLGKIRIGVLLPPQRLQDRLSEAGISFGDIVSFLGKAGGFLAGETTGQLIGMFGIGGLVGTGMAIVIEQLAEEILMRPQRKREFQNIVQLLTTSSKDSSQTL